VEDGVVRADLLLGADSSVERQLRRMTRAVAHSLATSRYLRTAGVPTTYGF